MARGVYSPSHGCVFVCACTCWLRRCSTFHQTGVVQESGKKSRRQRKYSRELQKSSRPVYTILTVIMYFVFFLIKIERLFVLTVYVLCWPVQGLAESHSREDKRYSNFLKVLQIYHFIDTYGCNCKMGCISIWIITIPMDFYSVQMKP